MIWTTAGTNRVCSRCLELKDKVVGYTDREGVQLPPLHPRCRCAIQYRETTPGRLLSTSPNKPASSESLTEPPHFVNSCKTFGELKTYWAENYNVIVGKNLSTLHFESVRAALEGVEAVFKEFLQAGRHLKEFGAFDAGIMCVSNNFSKINLNPKYFSNPAMLAKEFETGYYVKNMNAFGAGAHEAGHLIEYWLLQAHGISAREVVLAAYGSVVRSRGFKPLKVFTEEISRHARDKDFSECLADAAADCLVNGKSAVRLSKSIWRILKGEIPMVAYSELQLVKFSEEEINKYGLFDDFGFLVGTKEEAPAEFKAAWLADKKMYDDALKNSIIL